MCNIEDLPIKKQRDQLLRGEISFEDYYERYYKIYETIENKVEACLWNEREKIQEQIEELKKTSPASKLLYGIPIGIKDNIVTKDIRTTAGSKILEDFIPPYDATVINRIKNNGGIIFLKTNLDEFAMGSSNENSAFKITRNPWNLECVPGGSSGGSAVSVITREAAVSLGSDTGGSIRLPASFCGIYGLKPTYGLVSRYGLIAFASSLDQIGPMGKHIEDIALLLRVIAGYDQKDSTSVPIKIPPYDEIMEKRIYTIGIPKEFEDWKISDEVKSVFDETKKILEKLGNKFKYVSIPTIDYSVATYYIISSSEASSNLARYDGIRYGLRVWSEGKSLQELYVDTRTFGFGKEVKRRIMLGTFALSSGYYDAYYLKAQKVRRLIMEDFVRALNTVDMILLPVCAEKPFKIGEKIKDPLSMYLTDIFTIPCNLSGLPGISFPAGFSKNRLPIGLQFIGKPFQEIDLLNICKLFESETKINLEKPDLIRSL